MNVNEISPKPESKTNAASLRVVRISRTLKAIVLIYLFVLPLLSVATMKNKSFIWNFNGQVYSDFSTVPNGGKIVCVISAVVYLLTAIVFYRLLNLYEKGIFFSSQNARLFRALGYLAFCEGLIGVVSPVVATGQLNLTSLLFEILGSPWIVGGLFGIMISFIMDEGCKMREEQELTV